MVPGWRTAGGNDVQHRLLAVHHEGVAGIVAAVKAHHELRPRRQPVDELALALVSPLRAHRDECRHVPSSTSCTEIMLRDGAQAFP